MKPSHFETPRTLDNCTFQSWGQAIFPPERSSYSLAAYLYPAVLILAVIGFAIFATKALT